MRAQRYRPTFDALDVRMVLDSGSVMVSGNNVASTVLAAIDPNVPSILPNLLDSIDWNTVAITAPTGSAPLQMPIPFDLVP